MDEWYQDKENRAELRQLAGSYKLTRKVIISFAQSGLIQWPLSRNDKRFLSKLYRLSNSDIFYDFSTGKRSSERRQRLDRTVGLNMRQRWFYSYFVKRLAAKRVDKDGLQIRYSSKKALKDYLKNVPDNSCSELREAFEKTGDVPVRKTNDRLAKKIYSEINQMRKKAQNDIQRGHHNHLFTEKKKAEADALEKMADLRAQLTKAIRAAKKQTNEKEQKEKKMINKIGKIKNNKWIKKGWEKLPSGQWRPKFKRNPNYKPESGKSGIENDQQGKGAA